MTTFDPLVFLDNAGDWNRIINTVKTAQSQIEDSFIPISPFDLGIRIQRKAIVVLVNVNYQKSTWSYGGEIRQFYNFPATNQVQYIPNSLRINVPQLINLSNPAVGNFGLIYSPPKWFRDVHIRVWEYLGETVNFGSDALFNIETAVTGGNVSNGNDVFTQIINRLNDLEEKIDQLL